MTLSNCALARLISALELGGEDADRQLASLWCNAAPAHIIGISGPPGVGKSVIAGLLIKKAQESGHRVAVLAVDPSSPISGGAVLADRMRMQMHELGRDVFIRSLASRGSLGGLSHVVPAAIRAFEAANYDIIVVETVGVGQNETDILKVADTVLIVQSPGAGDEAQGLKAGVLEIADIFVLNKCDLVGMEAAHAMLLDVARSSRNGGWIKPIVQTTAVRGEGLEELWQSITAHRDWLRTTSNAIIRRANRVESEFFSALKAELERRANAVELPGKFASGKVTIREALKLLFNDENTSRNI